MENTLATDERAELERLRSIYRELWLRVVDGGSLLLNYQVEKALLGDTTLTGKSQAQGWIYGEQKIPDHVREQYFAA